MSRLFDGADDESRQAIGGTDFPFGTMVAVLERDNTSWASIMANHSASEAGVVGMLFNSGNQLAWFDQNSLKTAAGISTVTNATGWVLVAVTKATGTVAPRLHRYAFDTGTWQHADATGTVSNRAAQAHVRIGQIDNSDFFNGRMAVLAQWASVVLSDAQLESLITGFARTDWLALSPTMLVDEFDGFAGDHAGTSDQTLLVGTADDADDPAGWAGWASGGGESHSGAAASSGGGLSAALGLKHTAGPALSTGGGASEAAGIASENEQHAAVATSTGGGASTIIARKRAIAHHQELGPIPPLTVPIPGLTTTGGGASAATGIASELEQRVGSAASSGGGASAVQARKAGSGSALTMGAGNSAAAVRKRAAAAVASSGGGSSAVAGVSGEFAAGQARSSGGGGGAAHGRKRARAVAVTSAGAVCAAEGRKRGRSGAASTGGGVSVAAGVGAHVPTGRAVSTGGGASAVLARKRTRGQAVSVGAGLSRATVGHRSPTGIMTLTVTAAELGAWTITAEPVT